jgi:hypothetical protein
MTRASFAPSLVDPLGQVDSRGAASIEAAIVEQSMSEASSAGRPRLQRWDCRCRDAFPGPPSARCSLLRSSCGDMDDHRLSLRHAWRRMGQDRWGAGNNRYYHPLLIIEVTQFANLFAGARDRQAIVEVGRACAAFAGCLLVLLACAAGAARARRPGSNICDGGNANRQVHARIMKEDIFVAPFLILGLAELIKLLQYPTPLRALLTGVNAGLAGGVK